ncbi:MAG: class I SAM-dependent methyltransferase [Chloroflexota bacterium]|nr:class I SAM-dependent methyltransferase [Chloroflexota bacterium]
MNTFIDKREIADLSVVTAGVKSFDSYLGARLTEQEIEGLKVWEYGKLLGAMGDFSGLKVLDVGPGDSTFCIFMDSLGADVVTIDYPQPFAPDKEGFRTNCRRNGIAVHLGTMLQLPYEDESFDLVTCISTIEHLDTNQQWKPIPDRDFIDATIQALKEMCRVVKRGGQLFITSDAYDPERQRTDNWNLAFMYNDIGAAYSICDIEPIFVDTIEGAGLTFVNGHDYSRNLIIEDPQRCNYRGRYFTTFGVLARK